MQPGRASSKAYKVPGEERVHQRPGNRTKFARMLRVSLHKIALSACYGLYESEQSQPNQFEVDVDVFFAQDHPPFLDYVAVYEQVNTVFAENKEAQTLENAAKRIQERVRLLAGEAARVRVSVRKMQPPINGTVAYAEVCVE